MVMSTYVFVFFFKQKTAYEVRISDWSSDVCSSDLDVCGELANLGVAARAYELDVTDEENVPGLVDRVAEEFGSLDILVNNAYFGAHGPLLGMDAQKFQRGFRSAPFAAFNFMVAAHPHLVARGGGSIVTLVTSAMVQIGRASCRERGCQDV